MAKKNILYRSRLKNAKQLIADNKLDQAYDILLPISKKAPRDADVWMYLGIISGKKHDYDNAVTYLERSVSLAPSNINALYSYSVALRDSGKIDKSIASFRKVLQLDKGHHESAECLAHLFMQTSDVDAAIAFFEDYIQSNPAYGRAYMFLGTACQAKGLLTRAESLYREATRYSPDLDLTENLGSVLTSQGRLPEAMEIYKKKISGRRATGPRLHSNYLLSLNYLDGIDKEEVFSEHRAWGEYLISTYGGPGIEQPQNEKIRVGYYSPDFRDHSVSYFIDSVLEYHDKDQFTIYVYNAASTEDEVTQRLKIHVDVWRDVSHMTPDQLVKLVRSDCIDIAVDLAGHTSNNALVSFARGLSPVQVTYLGYPNTTGLSNIQYRITDSIADPPGEDRYYTEKLYRMPGCFLCYRPGNDFPEVDDTPALHNKYITFGSFNNLSKINDSVIDLWCRLLNKVDASRLLLKNASFSDQEIASRYISKFAELGIDKERLMFVGYAKSKSDHLKMYSQMDISLDTFPYNGTTTSCESLWMGVPLVTFEGDRHAGRVGASLLKAIGRYDWVAKEPGSYIDSAVKHCENISALQNTRLSLREIMKNSELCEPATFVRSLESAYHDFIKAEYSG